MNNEILDELTDCLKEYFECFIKYYPDSLSQKDETIFGPNELYQLSIKAHCLRAMLGAECVKRLNHIGFDEYIPFDNPVDWYNWKIEINEKKIPRETYLSIGIRIDSELERLRFFIEREQFGSYENLSYGRYFVSKERYFESSAKDNKQIHEEVNPQSKDGKIESCGNVANTNNNATSEKEAISNLDKLHKKSSIITSWLNILAKLSGL